jgi:hypothetical protein
MAEISLTISLFWEEQAGDCKPCEMCKEPIYLKRFVPVIQIGPSVNVLKVSYCESCYNLIEDGRNI